MEYLPYPSVLQGTVDHILVELEQGHTFEVRGGEFTYDPLITDCGASALSIHNNYFIE